MTDVRRATIKSYDSGTHRAAVQIAGSLGVWLEDLRVATNIPEGDVAAGRECTVLFLDDSNPDDAVIIAIQGQLPSGGGGGVTDHGALTGLADDDHTQYGALAQAETVAALWTFGAGLKLAASQTIQDSAGTARVLLATANPHVTLTGGVRVNSNAGIATDPSTSPNVKLVVSPTETDQTDWRGISMVPSITLTGNSRAAAGIFGSANIFGGSGSTGHNATGLDFVAAVAPSAGAVGIASAVGMRARPSFICIGTGKSLAVTEAVHIDARAPDLTVISSSGVTITDHHLFRGLASSISNALITITTAYGLRLGDLAGSSYGTVRLLEIGPSTPYLRLTGKADPASNETNLWLKEGTTLRQVKIKDGASIGAGDNVAVLV